MGFKKVTAIFRCDHCEAVERRLQELGVHGYTLTKVKGYGEYADLYSRDWLVDHARIEVFTETHKVDAIAEAIMDAAHVGQEGDGIVAVLPVEKLYRIRNRSEITPEQASTEG